MKKHVFAIFVGTMAFTLGISIVNVLQQHWFNERSEPEEVSALPEPLQAKSETVDCKESLSYPGRSRSISESRKYKNGLFPVGAFDDGWQNSDAGLNDWYGKFLRVMDEKSLLDRADDSTEIYRFLWLRTFDHPVSVRLERNGYSFKLISVELNGAGGYEPGRKWRTDNVSVSEKEWCEFMSLLETASFWSQPTTTRDDNGTDGSQWVLEGVRRNRYHVIDRWTPSDGEYRAACIYLLKLSGRDPEKMGNLY